MGAGILGWAGGWGGLVVCGVGRGGWGGMLGGVGVRWAGGVMGGHVLVWASYFWRNRSRIRAYPTRAQRVSSARGIRSLSDGGRRRRGQAPAPLGVASSALPRVSSAQASRPQCGPRCGDLPATLAFECRRAEPNRSWQAVAAVGRGVLRRVCHEPPHTAKTFPEAFRNFWADISGRPGSSRRFGCGCPVDVGDRLQLAVALISRSRRRSVAILWALRSLLLVPLWR